MRGTRVLRASFGLALAVSGLTAGLSWVAAGASPESVQLYVTTGGSGTTCTQTSPCGSIQTAVTKAETYGSSTAVTISVGRNTSAKSYGGPVTITAGALASLSIVGKTGPSATKVTGGGSVRDFVISAGTVSISGLSIDGGRASVDGGGMDIIGPGSSVTVSDGIFLHDAAEYGGAAYVSAASVAFTHVTFSTDAASEGGAVANYTGSTASFADDTFSGDRASYGGAVTNFTSTASFADDTFSGDSANGVSGDGGAIDNVRGTVATTDVTFSQDSSNDLGGALFNYAGTATLEFDTLSGNSARAGGGVANTDAGTTTSSASIFDASSCVDTGGTLSGTYDVVTTTTTCPFETGVSTTTTALDLASTLETTAFVWNAPAVLALGPTSPATNEVPKTVCMSAPTDERGAQRPGDRPGTTHATTCDAGAYELQHSAVALTQGTPKSGAVVQGTTSSFQLTVTNLPQTSGPLSFTSTSTTGVSVSSTGTITVTATAAVGTYALRGTESDPLYDSGTWTFTLSVVGKTGSPTTTTLDPVSSPVTYGAETQSFVGTVHGTHGTPAGTVTVKTTTGKTLCTAAVSAGSGTAGGFRCTQKSGSILTAGTYKVEAAFSGGSSSTPDYVYGASTSGTQMLFVASRPATHVTVPVTHVTVPVTHATAPGAPALTTAEPTAGKVHLVWSAPKTTGSSAVTGYLVCYATSSAAVATCTSSDSVSGTSDTVTGLTDGTTYFFAVKAENEAGYGPLSLTLTATPVPPPPAPATTRVAGATAGTTAAAELTRAFPYAKGECPPTRAAVVATTKTYQDALSSQYLAQSLTTGTLLTPAETLSSVAEVTLKEEGISTVYAVGGPKAITTTVLKAIEALTAFECGGKTRGATTGKIKVTRIWGTTQYGTAEAIAEQVGTGSSLAFPGAYATTNAAGGTGEFNDTPGLGTAAPTGTLPTAILASGVEFQDAQAASVVSYHTRVPLLLTPATALSTTAVAAIEKLGIKQVIVMGGTLAVTNSVERALVTKTGVSVLRVAGRDYTGTAVQLSRFEAAAKTMGLGWTPGHKLMVARGDGFTDGIAGAVLDSPKSTATGPAGTVRPLVLTETQTAVGTSLSAFLKTTGNRGIDGTAAKTVTAFTILGGPLAVSTAVVTRMRTDLAH